MKKDVTEEIVPISYAYVCVRGVADRRFCHEEVDAVFVSGVFSLDVSLEDKPVLQIGKSDRRCQFSHGPNSVSAVY